MTNQLLFEKEITFIKESLLLCMKDFISLQSKFNYPKPDVSFEAAVNKLQKKEFSVAVCGEVKKGKSTFINALVGKKILPEGVKETTSQVFRVSKAVVESFYLVFTNGSMAEISAEELFLYGSQMGEDSYGKQDFGGKDLFYIQINTPTSFLPADVTLIDTPGLGALYKSHSEITNTFIPLTDAVVFVFDIDKPLVTPEKEFLEKVYRKTPYVFYILTKIDTVKEEEWRSILQRNEGLLNNYFAGSSYKAIKIHPLSSRVLFNAANESNEQRQAMLVAYSRFRELKEELLKLLYTVSGFSIIAEANDEVLNFYNTILTTIEGNIILLTPNDKDYIKKLVEQNQALNTVKIELTQKLMPGGTFRVGIQSEIQNIVLGVKKNVQQLFDNSGPFYDKFATQIDSINDDDELTSYKTKMGEAVFDGINDETQAIFAKADKDIYLVLQKAVADIKTTAGETRDFLNESKKGGGRLEANWENAFINKFRSRTFMSGLVVTGLVLTGVVTVAAAVALALPIFAYNIFKSLRGATKEILKKNKEQLKGKLKEILAEARIQLTSVSPGTYKSILDSYTDELSSVANQAVTENLVRKKEQIEATINQNNELLSPSIANEKKLIALRREEEQWKDIGIKLADLQSKIASVSTILSQA